MEMRYVNLYEHYGKSAPENAGGILRCWNVNTSLEVSPSRKRPAVLIIPGGGYEFNSEREAEPIALQFLARGYVPFVLNYACKPHIFPVALRETAMAMRYIRENAGELEVDPGMVAAIGFSAGGHLCCCMGTMYDCPEVEDIASATMLRPDALGLCYPVIVASEPTRTIENISGGDPQLRQRMSLENQVRPDMPPVFLWHTRDDDLVPSRNSLILAQALEEKGVDFALYLYRHGWHGLATVDSLVFPAHVTPDCSRDVAGWIDSCVGFWEETGFHITDRQG